MAGGKATRGWQYRHARGLHNHAVVEASVALCVVCGADNTAATGDLGRTVEAPGARSFALSDILLTHFESVELSELLMKLCDTRAGQRRAVLPDNRLEAVNHGGH